MSNANSSATNSSSSAPAGRKLTVWRKISAFFLVLLFVAIGGSIVLYAKKTANDAPMTQTAKTGNPSASAAKSDPIPAPIADPSSAEMVVVDDSIVTNPISPSDSANSGANGNNADFDVLAGGTKPDSDSHAQSMTNMNGRSNAELQDVIYGLQKEIKTLNDRIGRMEQTAAQLQESEKRGLQNDMALLLAANNLQNAIESGRAFAQPFAMIKKLADGNDDIEKILMPLSDTAQTGIASVESLQAEFARIAQNILRNKTQQDATEWAAGWTGEGMIANAFGKMAGLVTLRRTTEGNDQDLQGKIATIDAQLARHQLREAIASAGGLPDNVRNETFNDWYGRLSGRADAEQSLQQLQNLIMTRLQGGVAVN